MACERSTWLYDFSHKNAIVTVTWKIIIAALLRAPLQAPGRGNEWDIDIPCEILIFYL
jgi:hypothetical protein